MTTRSFSRLQLAAALIEYDNDADDPEGPYRIARESAIFAHTRRSARPEDSYGGDSFRRSKADFLNVKLPSELDAASERKSMSSGRRTPLVGYGYQQDNEIHGEEVDLAEWGLAKKENEEEDKEEDDTFREPERRRAVSEFLPGPSVLPQDRGDRRLSIAKSELLPASGGFKDQRARRSSLGDFGAGGAFLDAARTFPGGRPDQGQRSFTEPISQQRRNSLVALDDSASLNNPWSPVDGPTTVPFPSTEPAPQEVEENPFALPPPSPSKSSRFDPKTHGRTLSTASIGSRATLMDDHRSSRYMSTGPGPDDARSSRYMPDDARSSQYFPADDGRSIAGSAYLRDAQAQGQGQAERDDARPRRLSGWNVLRPKVLVMPSPLQDEEHAAMPLDLASRGGFVHSKDGPPLPPGAKAEHPAPRPLSSMTLASKVDPLNPQSPLHLNPRESLTLSQLTFRNSLMNDVAYTDMGLRRAAEDGEKVTVEMEEEDEPLVKSGRAPGALYGRSLIDDLEARKAALRGKQRVFKGDDRPSMMDRSGVKRSSTLIDPASFGDTRPPLARRNTNMSTGSGRMGNAPLLSFEGEDTLTSPIDPTGTNRIAKSKSTFGVDQLWEKELAKLQVIEAEEQKAAEAQRKKDEEEEARRRKKVKGKGTREPSALAQSAPAQPPSVRRMSSNLELPAVSAGASLLDDSNRRHSTVTLGVNNWFNSDNDEDDEDESGGERAELITPKKARQTTYNSPPTLPPSLPSLSHQVDDSSEDEDVPLAARMQKLAGTGLPHKDSDSEEEEMPLAAVIAKKQLERSTSSKPGSLGSGKPGSTESPRSPSFTAPAKGAALPNLDFGGTTGGFAESLGLGISSAANETSTKRATAAADDSDEDNVPLGLRHPSTHIHSPGNAGDEDEAPLGMRFPQAAMQQQAQAQALQQQQYMQMMMQQQMVWQAEQMRTSMAFGGGMTPQMTGFPMSYGMGAPAVIPPAMSDPGKFNRVDQWRRGVGADEQ
ncbi:hypothetical protein DACRYDRAFT_113208 [Dacryopinax primogenitus]|uniref:Uncharacterized protein n=1 Tax=Dacryopinax primogenitus (strain DJM 731) TaxID=1858805 RepID=M5GBZ1_DACPD|nr:uncharacterized protein DACRYDRAFT_113208 [Dacryopinax primogenitus]EJU06524.1 hypothetical protein DACRYDRAFT_113208 [Dacryopinax primogenitus]